MPLFRRLFVPLLLLVCGLCAAPLPGQTSFNAVVVFGDSLSDTGNIAHLTQQATAGLVRYPGDYPLLSLDYTDGRFTDGKDTQPAAQAYFGVWVEQLAASFPAKPAVTDALDGGTNYAYGDATTAMGTTMVSDAGYTITLHNMGQQVADYLGQSPAPVPNAQTLYVLWGGSNDLLQAVSNAAMQSQDPIAAATMAASTAVANEVGYIQQLVQAGATQFLVPNVPPLGALPDSAGTAGATALNAGSLAFQQGLAQALTNLVSSYAAQGVTIQVYQPDVFTAFSDVATSPMSFAIGNLSAAAQNVSGSPDPYLIWDGLHPTTTGHHIAASVAANLLTPLVTSTVVLSPVATAVGGQNVTLTAQVSGTAQGAVPTGLVTFFNGTTAVGSAALTGTGTGTATFAVPAGAGSLTLEAVYAGDTTYARSTSASVPFTVLGSAIATSTTLTANITYGGGSSEQAVLAATVTAADNSQGVPTGTVTFYDGTTNLGTGTLANGVAQYTAGAISLGSHSFTASYGANGLFAASTSAAVTEGAAGFTSTVSPTSLSVTRGTSGTVAVSAVAMGNFSGPLTLSCGTLPSEVSCSFASTTYTLPASGAAPSPVTLTLNSVILLSQAKPRERPVASGEPKLFSALLIGAFGCCLTFGRRRGALRGTRLLPLLLVLLSTGAALALSGCGGSSNNSAHNTTATYTVPVIFTPAASTTLAAQTVNVTLTVTPAP